MKKRKTQNQAHARSHRKETDTGQLTLGDMIKGDMLSKLKETHSELEKEKQAALLKEEERKREERKQREKNKSFEELLNESSTDWRKFK
ncbi:YqkE family protein [Peribacillus sp. SCS-37]|uniref:YqkE family protein n=1 Tax=Paraperibacillus esterisolvens TaxID=3115296 RepID=UPI003905F03F